MTSNGVKVTQTNDTVSNDIVSNDNGLEYNKILDRNDEILKLKQWLFEFEINKNEKNIQRGVYIYGAPGSGKTYLVKQLLKKLKPLVKSMPSNLLIKA